MHLKLKIILLLDKVLPFAGPIKRFIYAFWHASTPMRKSYSQFGEDTMIAGEFEGWVPEETMYVDVGANHPTQISNSYLLYRKGYHGITIEPNAELVKLHRIFRRRDIQVNAGCGSKATLLQFYVSRTPVLSSFSKKEVKHFSRLEYLPILTIDQLLAPFKDNRIAFLSVDTEGFDLDVLLGAKETLKRTHLVCVEANDLGERDKIQEMMSENFEHFATVGCNEIFRHRKRI
jgi:FkbM family methyltransferase